MEEFYHEPTRTATSCGLKVREVRGKIFFWGIPIELL